MLILTDPDDTDEVHLHGLLRRRFEELADYGCPISDLARFHLVQPGDDVRLLLTNAVDGSRYGDPGFEPSWEWVKRHTDFYEAVFVLDDAGFGHVYFIPDRPDIDPELLSLCRAHTADQDDPQLS